MSTNIIDSENATEPKPETKGQRKVTKKRAAKVAKKPVGKPKPEHANKKAEVIAMLKRAKGATLAEIMKTTGWRAHTVRGFISILGSKGGEKIESPKNDAGSASAASPSNHSARLPNAASGSSRRRRFCLCRPPCITLGKKNLGAIVFATRIAAPACTVRGGPPCNALSGSYPEGRIAGYRSRCLREASGGSSAARTLVRKPVGEDVHCRASPSMQHGQDPDFRA